MMASFTENTVDVTMQVSTPSGNSIVKIGSRKTNWYKDCTIKRPFNHSAIKMILAEKRKEMPFMNRCFEQYSKEIGDNLLADLCEELFGACWRKGTPEYFADVLWGSRKRRERWIDLMHKTKVELDEFEDKPEENPVTQGIEDDLEQTENISGHGNVTFVDERPMNAVPAHIKGDKPTQDTHADVSETKWTIETLLQREMVVKTIVWKTGDRGDIAILPFPKVMMVTDSVVVQQLRMVGLMRTDIEIRIVLNGNKFMIGRMLAHVEPVMFWSDVTTHDGPSYVNFPHVFLDASVSNVAILRLPFSHILTHLPQTPHSLEDPTMNAIGRLYFSVFNALQAPEGGSQRVSITVYARFVNPEIHQTCSAVHDFGYSDGFCEFEQDTSDEDDAPEDDEPVTQGKNDGTPIVNRSVQPPCYGDTDDSSILLSLNRTQSRNADLVSTGGEDFDLHAALQIPGLVAQVSWVVGHEVNSDLIRFPMTPGYISDINISYSAGVGVVYRPTFLNYISRCFAFWSGDLMIKVQVIGNAFASGRLLHTYDPLWTPAHGDFSDVEELMNYNCVVQDIQEQQEMVLRVPFMSIKPFLKCDSWTVSSNYDKVSEVKMGETFMGIFRTIILNELVMPAGMTSHIDINFYLYAAENFKLEVPISLSPLAIDPGANKRSARDPEYPVYLESQKPLEYDNLDYIRYVWYVGQRLSKAGLIKAANEWWNSPLIPGKGEIDEVYAYLYRCRQLKKYQTALPNSRQAKLMRGLGTFSDSPIPRVVEMMEVVKEETTEQMEIEGEEMQTQGLEEYISTRTSKELVPVVMTKGNRPQTAPDIEKNSLKTFLYRYYPLHVMRPRQALTGFTAIYIPVKPTFVPPHRAPINKSAATETPTHPLAWISQMYGFWSGSLKYKFLFSGKSKAEVFVAYIPQDNQKFQIYSGASEVDVHTLLCYAADLAVTHQQGSLEVTVPFSSPYNQCFIDKRAEHHDARCQNGTLVFYYRNGMTMNDNPLTAITMLVGAGPDFKLNWLMCPPKVFDPALYFNCAADQQKEWGFSEPHKNQGDACRTIVNPNNCGFVSLRSEMEICDPGTGAVTQGLTDYFLTDINRAARSLPEKIDEFNDNVRQAREALTTFTETSNDTHKKAAHYLDLAASTILAGNTVRAFVKACENPSIGSCLDLGLSAAALLGFNVRRTLLDGLKNLLHYFDRKEQAQAQAMNGAIADFVEDNENIITKCFAVLGTVLYAYVFDCLPDFSKFKGLIRSFLEAEPVTQGFDLRGAHFGYLGVSALCKVFDNLVYYARKFVDWALERDSPESLLARKACAIQARVMQLITDLDELDNEVEIIRAMADPFVHNKFYGLVHESNELTDIFMKGEMDARVGTLLTECRTRAKNLVRRLEKEAPTHGWRYDPFVICIHGPTGTGKTAIMREISNVIAEEMSLSKYNRVYNKTINDDFWSGYTAQPIVHWDEFGQNAKKDESVAEFVELRGNDPHKLNMAALEEKGRFFVSRAVIMTTNVPYHTFNTVIRDQTAYLRRRHMMIGMRHRAGANVTRLQNSERFDPDYGHCEFRLGNPFRNNDESEPMIKEEIMEAIVAKVRRWNRKQTAMYEEYVAERGLGILPRGITPIFTEVNEDDLDDHAAQEAGNLVILPEATEPIPEYDITNRRPKQSVCMVMGASDDLLAKLNSHKSFKPCISSKIYHMTLDTSQCDMSGLNAQYINNVHGCYVRVVDPGSMKKGLVDWGKEKVNSLYKRAKVLFETLQEKIVNIYHKYPKLMIAGAALGTLTAVVTAFMLIRSSESEGEPKEQIPVCAWAVPEQAYDVHMKKPAVKMIKAEEKYEHQQNKKPQEWIKAENQQYDIQQKKPAANLIRAEGNEDQCSTEIRKVVHPNLVVIGWQQGSKKMTTLRGLHIAGQILLTPHHFFNGAREGDYFILNHRYHPVLIEFNNDRMIRLDDKDWCLYDCGPRFEPRRNISKYFVSEKNLGKLNTVRAILANVLVDGTQVIQKGIAKSVLNYKYKDEQVGNHYIQQGWETNFPTEGGDCGALLLALSNTLPAPGKILGIHTAGYQKRSLGFSVLITKEMIDRAMDQLPKQVMGMPVPAEVDRDECVAQHMKICPEGDYSIYGTLPNKMSPAQPVKTAFEKTPFSEEKLKNIPNPKKPAHLHPFMGPNGEKISPLKAALKKYGKQTKPFPRRNIKKAIAFVTNLFKNKLTGTQKRVYTEKEAINGIPGMEFAERLNMKSSPGWPYQVIEKGEPGKFYLFDDEGNVVNEELRKRIDERHEAAKKGERVPSLWRDCLKDELRPNAKVDEGKTRLFTIAPVDYTILVRQYFMDFAVAFYGNSCNFFSAVGVNPESYEWTKAYNYLAKTGKKCVAGDYSTFDGTLMPELIDACAEIISGWYGDTDEEKACRKVFINEMIHTMQLIENCVYATHQGNPSGNPLTVIINTIVNFLYMCLVFLEIYPDATLEQFYEFVTILCYGDDVLITVMELFEKFNFNNIKKVLEEHGIGFTSDQKVSDNVPDFVDLDTVTFLKRGFRKDVEFGSQFKLPTMSTDTLYSYFHWVRKSEEQEDQLRENMRSALTFAAFHGRTFYEQYHLKWEECMRDVGYQPMCITFEEQVDNFLFTANAACQVGADRQFFDNLFVEGGEGTLKQKHQDVISNDETAVVCWENFWKLLKGMGLGLYIYGVYKCWSFLSRKNADLQKALEKVTDDDRWAICMPSGEGKTTLARKYDRYFVDIDDLVLFKGQYPALQAYTEARMLREYGVSASEVKNLAVAKQISLIMNMKIWYLDWIRSEEQPKLDRRIMLTHAPLNTKRRVAACFMLPNPTNIRNNELGRKGLVNEPTLEILDFEQRERRCLEIVKDKEPAVWNYTATIFPIKRTVGHFATIDT